MKVQPPWHHVLIGVVKQNTFFLCSFKPKFLVKFGLEIGVYQNAPPIGGTFGEVSESKRLLGSARQPHHYISIFGIGLEMIQLWTIYVCPYMGLHPYFDIIMSTECPKYDIF